MHFIPEWRPNIWINIQHIRHKHGPFQQNGNENGKCYHLIRLIGNIISTFSFLSCVKFARTNTDTRRVQKALTWFEFIFHWRKIKMERNKKRALMDSHKDIFFCQCDPLCPRTCCYSVYFIHSYDSNIENKNGFIYVSIFSPSHRFRINVFKFFRFCCSDIDFRAMMDGSLNFEYPNKYHRYWSVCYNQ